MNRLDLPTFFDDHAGLQALSTNRQVGSYPELQAHVAAIREGYTQYVAASGNVSAINPVPLPAPIGAFLKGHYAKPPVCIRYINEIRERSGVNTCPMCGSMHCGTLDHVMPKGGHPAFAIFGVNLVPACKCNVLRSTALTGETASERVLHPYFDDVLAERLLAARFDDLGPVPRISLRIALVADHADFAAVAFHAKVVVGRTQVRDYLSKTWVKFVRRPSSVVPELRHDPATRADLVDILEHQLENFDDFHESKNNWNSMFVMGLLDDDVIDWIFARFSLPGRLPNSSL